ncbi:MAG: D-3-phosphoglycerate dehydrogenase / 2-oxoglutarate reductase [Chloroflexota bacterium]|nr:D-3-phosphoglycerate dehydrogenase / 2-oxoglutarate reductase [Chloroflexota bacterium]
MEPWRVLVTDGLQESGFSILSREAEVDDRKGISSDELLQEIGNYDAMIVRGRTKVTREVIDAGKKLKVIGRAGVGVDNIDTAYAKEKGVTVVNAPTATTTAVAELAMALVFALAREIPRADATMKAGKWAKKEFEGVELYGKTLGIIGFGRIGSTVGQMAAAVGMRIMACCLFRIPETIRIIGGELLMMDDIIEKSDFITIHTPLTDETRGMLNAEAFARMKDGVYLICTARGGIIDEKALLDALNSGKVAGAALDVYESEPPVFKELIDHPRVIATPHMGGQTAEAQRRASMDISKEVMAALKGDKLHWKIV